MVRAARRLAACGVIVAAPILLAGPAAAEPEPAGVSVSGNGGCSGTAVTTDADGNALGLADTAAGIAASASRPLLVATDGSVAYEGRSSVAITDHTWSVSVAGQTVASGSSANTGQATTAKGVAQVGDYLPVSVTGTVLAQATIIGTGGSCSGDVWLELDGNPWTSSNGVAGLVLTGAGLVGLAFVRPRRLAGGVS